MFYNFLQTQLKLINMFPNYCNRIIIIFTTYNNLGFVINSKDPLQNLEKHNVVYKI